MCRQLKTSNVFEMGDLGLGWDVEDGDHVDSTSLVLFVFWGEVVLGWFVNVAEFALIHGFLRQSFLKRFSGFDFDKYEGLTGLKDEVDFTQRSSVVGSYESIAFILKMSFC